MPCETRAQQIQLVTEKQKKKTERNGGWTAV
jgi:hypothetical protein